MQICENAHGFYSYYRAVGVTAFGVGAASVGWTTVKQNAMFRNFLHLKKIQVIQAYFTEFYFIIQNTYHVNLMNYLCKCWPTVMEFLTKMRQTCVK